MMGVKSEHWMNTVKSRVFEKKKKKKKKREERGVSFMVYGILENLFFISIVLCVWSLDLWELKNSTFNHIITHFFNGSLSSKPYQSYHSHKLHIKNYHPSIQSISHLNGSKLLSTCESNICCFFFN